LTGRFGALFQPKIQLFGGGSNEKCNADFWPCFFIFCLMGNTAKTNPKVLKMFRFSNIPTKQLNGPVCPDWVTKQAED
jgi:hypothetical protein